MNENLGIKMTVSNNELNLKNLPTLSEFLLVEEALQDSNESIVTMSQLKKLLQGKINKNTLTVILDYLEESNKILVTIKGITWIKSNKKLLDLFDKLLEKSTLTEEDALRLGRQINKNATRKFYDSYEKNKKNKTLKKMQRKKREKRDVNWNKILEKDDFLPLERL